MLKYLAALAIVAATSLTPAAQAQTSTAATPSIAAVKNAELKPYVNQYVYAADGSVAGILHHLRGPNQAVVAVSAFTGAAPMVAVPVADLDVIAGRVIIHNATFASLTRLSETN